MWQPIETAPTDGTPILVYAPGTNSWNREDGMPDLFVAVAVPLYKGIAWRSDLGDVDQGYESTGAYFVREDLRPTHWQPLPGPPAN